MIFVGNNTAPNLIETLKKHYTENDQRRWARLEQDQLWVVPDLVSLFTHWNPVVEAMKADLEHASISQRKDMFPVMVQTRVLHQQMAKVIELREALRVHQAIAERVIELCADRPRGEELSKRLKKFEAQMKYDATTINTIMEQLQNLIQLVGLSR